MRHSYTVHEEEFGLWIEGLIPIGDLTALVSARPELAYMDSGLALRLGASTVLVSKEGQKAWREKLSKPRPEPDASIGERVDWWPHSFDCGSSSITMWEAFAGRRFPWPRHNVDPHIPGDRSDLGRCVRLLELVPEWDERIAELAELDRWPPIVAHWSELMETYSKGTYFTIREDGTTSC
ncbi:MAG: hypothetical protein ACYTFG_00015 [Planctomycetota bacterium]|jgi:hypothetical protein